MVGLGGKGGVVGLGGKGSGRVRCKGLGGKG